MKSFFLFITFTLLLLHSPSAFSQFSDNENLNNTILKNACTCIENINIDDQTSEQVAKEINKCLEKQYVILLIFNEMNSKNLKPKDLKKKKYKYIVDNAVRFDRNSEEFNTFYYELERILMNDCSAMRSKISSNEVLHSSSISYNIEAVKLYDKGIQSDKKGNFRESISYYKQALAIDSVFAFAWDNLGLAYRKIGEYDSALYAYQKSLEINPEGKMPRQNLAVVYQYKKEYEKAIEVYNQIAEIDPDDPEVYYGMGVVYALELNDFEQGLHQMCKAFNLYVKQKSPYRSDAEKVISTIYHNMKDLGQEELFYKILEENNINAK